MDTVTAALLGVGAALLTSGGLAGDSFSVWSAVLLTGAFYGVHRVVQTRASTTLLFAPTVSWAFHRFWSFLPSESASTLRTKAGMFAKVPDGIGMLVLLVAIAASVLIARARVGRVLAWMTAVALVVPFLLG